MSLEPGQQVVWIGDLFVDERAPMALCAPHVARVSVPSGWDINDVRDDAPAFWRDDAIDEVPAERAAACVAPRSRARRRWSSGKMQALPGLFDAAPQEFLIETEAPVETPSVSETEAGELNRVAIVAVPFAEPVDEASKQSLDGLSAMYGSTATEQDVEPEQNPEEELIESLLAAETPLLARAFRNARAS